MITDIKVLLADDHSVVRQGVYLILKEDYKNLAISHAEDFGKIMTKIEQEAFDFIVLDIAIPEGKGIQMISLIKAVRPNIKILIFSAYDEDLYAVRYLKSGADGYLNKLCSEAEFKLAFSSILDGGTYISESIKQKMEENLLNKHAANPLGVLSAREMEIARLLIKGEGNLEIANKLYLQNSTVSTYKNRIFEKLEVSNTVALALLFRSHDEAAFN
ncbi:response regulator [Flavobacterium sp. 3HN19-14]|uniref:response regulator n=1 Tax=Flavobacterium sp. 3HN19-14 TaxID=3448133 RepID=UPI003EE32B6B